MNASADDPEQQVTQCFHPEHSELSSITHLYSADTQNITRRRHYREFQRI